VTEETQTSAQRPLKVLVGTLKTIENEFSECRDRIAQQTYPCIEHKVFENLPNAEAHLKLFHHFLERKNEVDLLVKVDADTVLKDTHSIEEIVKRFQDNDSLEHVQYQLFDFFTNKPIWGLNCYRNTIELREQDPLFVDRFVVGKPEKRIFLEGEIAGNHSPNPSDFQALHFGFHRQLKKQYPQVIFPMFKAYLKTLNRKRAMALVGTILVQKGVLSEANNKIYEDPSLLEQARRFGKRNSVYLAIYIFSNYLWYFLRKVGFLKTLAKK